MYDDELLGLEEERPREHARPMTLVWWTVMFVPLGLLLLLIVSASPRSRSGNRAATYTPHSSDGRSQPFTAGRPTVSPPTLLKDPSPHGNDRPARPLGQPVVAPAERQVALSAGRFNVKLLRADLATVRVKVGLAEGRVGRTESLEGIASRYDAIAAINGSFFDAYTSRALKNPHHTLVTDGVVVHKGNVGSILGFTAQNEAFMARLPLKVVGSLDGSDKWPNNWYAYWINRAPEGKETVTIFDRYWGDRTGIEDRHTQVVVHSGVVAAVGRGSQAVPEDGYVIYLSGDEEVSLAGRFTVGGRCRYRVVREDGGNMGSWGVVREALGCGPRLLTDGAVTVNATPEGFSHPKILSMACVRSAVGVTSDESLLLVTCSAATIAQLAQVMKSLGALQAMNLDGGASTGLWFRGRYLTEPGRAISNALLVKAPVP